jgi:hypothetical protein
MRIIPKKKIKDLRFGQLLVNAFVKGGYIADLTGKTSDNIGTVYIDSTKLFYIENDELNKILLEYIDDV